MILLRQVHNVFFKDRTKALSFIADAINVLILGYHEVLVEEGEFFLVFVEGCELALHEFGV